MATTNFDIAILGTGPVGCALALSLAIAHKQPEKIALIGLPPRQTAKGETFDPRALAMNYGSRQFISQIKAWPNESADILNVQVSQAGHLGQTIIKHTELGVAQLGSVVTYDNLLSSLYKALQESGISLIQEKFDTPKPTNTIQIKTSNSNITSRLAVISHGNQPHGIHREYNQHALLATIQASQAMPGYAFERFTQTGPLALLPHPQANDLYSLVWCLPPDQTHRLKQASNSHFEQSLNHAFGKRLGQLKLYGERFSFPLNLYAGTQIHGQNLIAIGNAAQTMHPVAGQGLNLGLRDVAQLSHVLRPWLARPDHNIQELLLKYSKQRRIDRGLTMAITDTLPRIFATNNSLQKHACGLGLLAMDIIAPLRNNFARHLLQGQRL